MMAIHPATNRTIEAAKFFFPVVPGLVLVMALQGCSVCEVSLRDGNAANSIHSEGTLFGNHYIVVQPDQGQPGSAGLHDVVVKDNFFYDVIGVVTLGFFKPCDVSYRNI